MKYNNMTKYKKFQGIDFAHTQMCKAAYTKKYKTLLKGINKL